MFLLAVKKSHLSERVMARSVLLNCPIKAYIRQMIANQIWEFCYKYDYKHNCPSFWPIYFLQVKQADRYITVRLQKTVNTWFWQVNCVVTNHNKFRTCEQTSKTNHELITVAFSVFFFSRLIGFFPGCTITFLVIRMAPWVGKMTRILCFDWLPELARRAWDLACSGTPVLFHQKTFSFGHMINKSFINRRGAYIRSKMANYGLVLFCLFSDQYLAIFNSRLVNNACIRVFWVSPQG